MSNILFSIVSLSLLLYILFLLIGFQGVTQNREAQGLEDTKGNDPNSN
tara:strand:- start:402 stop:545 length:144 start_codon:yes stop_codon:yes gene_type:complete